MWFVGIEVDVFGGGVMGEESLSEGKKYVVKRRSGKCPKASCDNRII